MVPCTYFNWHWFQVSAKECSLNISTEIAIEVEGKGLESMASGMYALSFRLASRWVDRYISYVVRSPCYHTPVQGLKIVEVTLLVFPTVTSLDCESISTQGWSGSFPPQCRSP